MTQRSFLLQRHCLDIAVDDLDEQAELLVGDVPALVIDDVQTVPVAAGKQYAVAGDVQRSAQRAQHLDGDGIPSVFHQRDILGRAAQYFGELLLGEPGVFPRLFYLQAHLNAGFVFHILSILPPCFKFISNKA